MSNQITRREPSIVTTSWFTELPSDIARIGISRGPPRGQRGFRRLPILEPGPWYRSVDEAEYVARYQAQLACLEPRHIYDRLITLAGGAPRIALCCFERPATDDGWCHRSLVAGWLASALGIAVKEYGFEQLESGDHPMLPEAARRSRGIAP